MSEKSTPANHDSGTQATPTPGETPPSKGRWWVSLAWILVFVNCGFLLYLILTVFNPSYGFDFLHICFFISCLVMSFALLTGMHFIKTPGDDSKPPEQARQITPAPSLPQDPNANLNLSRLCSLMQEGFALMRGNNLLCVNTSLAYMLGEQEERLAGVSINEFVHREDLPLLNTARLERSGNGPATPSRVTLRLLTGLGDVRWVICSVYRVLWQNENTELLLFENIGPLKQAQRSLEEQEQQSRVLIERTPLGIAMFDPIGQLRLANTAWYSLWSNVTGVGSRRFNILQDPFLPRQDVENAIRQAYNGHEAAVNSLEHASPWGETRWLNMAFNPMRNSEGQLIGMVMVQQDITEQARSSRREQELTEQLTAMRADCLESGEQLTGLLDALPMVLIITDREGQITAWNSAATSRYALEPQQTMGRKLNTLGRPFDLLANLVGQAAADNAPASLDLSPERAIASPIGRNNTAFLICVQ